jgi:hypothetical protein
MGKEPQLMEDREFFDLIYSKWAKTTGAEDRYWMPEEEGPTFPGKYFIYAVGQEQYGMKQVAECLSDEDSDFITAIHGCLPDLVRRLNAAIDESDRLSYERDEQEGRIALLEMEATQLEAEVARLKRGQMF